MYVDEQTDDPTATDDTSGGDELTVEVDGESYEVEENYDFDQDGANDTAVVETEDGYIAFADTDGDGTADVAVEFDQDGNVVAGAEYDESSGEWKEEDVDSLPTPGGDGSDDGSGGHTGTPHSTADDGDEGSTSTPHSTTDDGDDSTHASDGADIVVETPDGQMDAGPAQYDTDGDGQNDTAVVTDSDGTTYAFTDTDGDGDADSAVVIEADGDVTVAENTGGDQWEVTETGHVSADGTYESDSGQSGSDSVWAESK